MTEPLPPSAAKVQAALAAHGVHADVIHYPAGTRTAADAAAAIGCDVAQIVKSLVFRTASGRAVLVLTSGANRADERRVASLAGDPIERADAAFVRERTGFAIGGVPPLAHPEPLTAFIDEDLLRLPELWAAAGTPHTVFRLDPRDLQRVTGGTIADLKAR